MVIIQNITKKKNVITIVIVVQVIPVIKKEEYVVEILV